MNETKQKILSQLKHGIIVSCQMEKHAPCYSDEIVELMAKATLWGGAVGLRLNGIENIKKIRSFTEVPIIGLVKVFREDSEVFMTPSMQYVDAVIEAGANIVAIDGTSRLIDGVPANHIIKEIKNKYSEILVFADVRNIEDALESIKLGADIVAPTFYRFDKNAKSTDLPDWEMFAHMCQVVKDRAIVMMEGKVWSPDDAIKAFHYGAYSVVVGSAITRPHLITQRFVDHVKGFPTKRKLIY